MVERLRKHRIQANLLSEIANGCRKVSAERRLLERASYAFFFISLHHGDEFDQFLLDMRRKLTPNEKRQIKHLEAE